MIIFMFNYSQLLYIYNYLHIIDFTFFSPGINTGETYVIPGE